MTALLRSSRRLLVVLAVALGATLALTTALPASASNTDSERRRDYYGALSISVDNAWGGSYDYATKRKAIKRAQSECKIRSDRPGTCESAVWVRNGCAALSVKLNRHGFVTRYGWAVDRFKGPAIRAAQQKCGKRCVKRAWVCTTRP